MSYFSDLFNIISEKTDQFSRWLNKPDDKERSVYEKAWWNFNCSEDYN